MQKLHLSSWTSCLHYVSQLYLHMNGKGLMLLDASVAPLIDAISTGRLCIASLSTKQWFAHCAAWKLSFYSSLGTVPAYISPVSGREEAAGAELFR